MQGILKDNHLDMLRKLSQMCDATRQFLQDCKDCYLNVDEEIASNEEQAKICEAIRRKAFPNRE